MFLCNKLFSELNCLSLFSTMVATNLKKYENVRDKYGVTVGSWAVQTAPSYFQCTICIPTKTLCFKQGKCELTKHSESKRHRDQAESDENVKSRQPTVKDLLINKEESMKKEELIIFC